MRVCDGVSHPPRTTRDTRGRDRAGIGVWRVVMLPLLACAASRITNDALVSSSRPDGNGGCWTRHERHDCGPGHGAQLVVNAAVTVEKKLGLCMSRCKAQPGCTAITIRTDARHKHGGLGCSLRAAVDTDACERADGVETWLMIAQNMTLDGGDGGSQRARKDLCRSGEKGCLDAYEAALPEQWAVATAHRGGQHGRNTSLALLDSLLELVSFSIENIHRRMPREVLQDRTWWGMGTVGNKYSQAHDYYELVEREARRRREADGPPLHLCEVGLNGGHSAVLFLEAAGRGATLHAFDTGCMAYTRTARLLVDRLYPGQLHYVEGESQTTVRRFASTHGRLCDVMSIDGNHRRDEVARDIAAARRASKPGALVLLHGVVTPCPFPSSLGLTLPLIPCRRARPLRRHGHPPRRHGAGGRRGSHDGGRRQHPHLAAMRGRSAHRHPGEPPLCARGACEAAGVGVVPCTLHIVARGCRETRTEHRNSYTRPRPSQAKLELRPRHQSSCIAWGMSTCA